MWDSAKTVSRGSFIALNAHIRKEERFKPITLFFLFKKLEQIIPKLSRKKKIVNVNVVHYINKIFLKADNHPNRYRKSL